MANIPFKSITFPGLPNKYTVPEISNDLMTAGKAADAKKTGDALSALEDAVTEETDKLKADLGAFQVEGEIANYTIEQGTIDRTGYSQTSPTRCRTNYIEFAGNRMVVTPKEGYKISSRVYNAKSASSFDHGDTEWSTDPIVCTDSTMFYRFVVAKADDSVITASELPEDVVTIKYYDSTDKSLSIDGKSADAGAVGNLVESITAQIDDLSQKIGFTAEKHVDKWNNGTINTSTGEHSGAKSNRSYTNKLYFDDTFDSKITIHTSTDYGVSIRAYKRSDDSYMGMPFDGFVTGEYEFTVNPEWYYRFVLARNDDADFAEKNVVYTDVYFSFTTDNEQLSLIKRNNIFETVAMLQQLNRKTRVAKNSWGNSPLCFIHFSDIHGHSAVLADIVKFKNEYSAYIKDILHTGDSVYYSATDGMGFWNCIDGAEKILNVIGNHDTKASQSGEWTGLSMAEAYAAYMAPYISNWGATYTADKTYYYKDYATEGVRLIVLDIMHQTAEQLAWFETTLASAITAGLDVVCAIHCRAHWLFEANSSVWDDKGNVPEYSTGYYDTSAYTGSNYPSNLADEYMDAVDDFIDNGGYFICWLHGHTHFRILAHLQTHSRQLDVSVANAGFFDDTNTYVWERVLDTKSMDDFNVVGIDTTGKILRIAKFGVNTDRLMRVAHTMSYNYKTHTIINAS